ncbi:uncharacterized protein LOC113762476 [Coffea eugenioides]|uniref:Uncharacterized protein isoform X1 n=1 Tax=Coffea arabica TaxID=13443 RepID=A0A6P6WC30_COFAR|nr:uncharacterized protein LOC113731766 isoform X1 [Coffea arabica]XP_027161741.1 uncharacterized protein LOC113762476 [Coffea eugenioides]
MPKSKNSYSISDEIESAQRSSSSEEVEVPENNVAQKKKITEYERQRMKRIEENRARMEALGLKKMANSFVGSLTKSAKEMVDKKGKRKMDDDDEEYRPSDEGEEEALSSSSEDDDTNVDDEDYSGSSAKRKAKNRIQMPKKNVTPQKPVNDLDFVDDNDALLQAIALSLQDSAGFSNRRTGASQSSTGYHVNGRTNEGKENSHVQEDAGKIKRKKSMNSRVQMTEDELILHFFQFDEAGKGGITLRDLRRVAVAHDFTWSDKEMADMIKCFDIDGDGKLSLDDFCKIAGRCSMIQAS